MTLWKRLTAAALLCTASIPCTTAQLPRVDSIRASIDTIQDDSARVMAYLKAFKPLVITMPDTSMAFVTEALEIAQQSGLRHSEAEATRMQGIYYMFSGATDLALERFQAAYDIFQELGDTVAYLRNANNFATVYMNLEQYDSALTYLRPFDTYQPKTATDTIFHSTGLHNRAICLDMLGRHTEAFAIFQQNLQSFIAVKAEYEQSFTLNSLGEVAVKLGRHHEALEYLRRAEALKQKLGDQRGYANALLQLGSAYLGLSQLDSALTLTERGLATARAVHAAEMERDGILQRAKILAQRGDHPAAYADLLRHIDLADSLSKALNASKLLRMQSAYGLKRNREEILRLEQATALDQSNITRQRLLIFVLIGGILAVALMLLLQVRATRTRQRLNAELTQANQALAHSIQEREALLHMVIHDLKAPLTSTEGLLRMMRALPDMPAMALTVADKIGTSNQRGMALINDLLDLYQIETSGKVELGLVTPDAILTAALQSCEGNAEAKGIRLVLKPSPGLPALHTNLSMASRILENYISNALKFSQPGTQVEVYAEAQAGGVRLSVRDQGPGISQEDQRKLFQRFARLSATPTGGEKSTGLGLAIVKKLSERLGGKLEVSSELGKGSTFSLWLPG